LGTGSSLRKDHGDEGKLEESPTTNANDDSNLKK
jgi:hypothetical protein